MFISLPISFSIISISVVVVVAVCVDSLSLKLGSEFVNSLFIRPCCGFNSTKKKRKKEEKVSEQFACC